MKLYNLKTQIDFGQYKGEIIDNIFDKNSNYIFWCFKNIDWFCVNDELFNIMLEQKIGSSDVIINLMEGNFEKANEISVKEKDELLLIHINKNKKLLNEII